MRPSPNRIRLHGTRSGRTSSGEITATRPSTSRMLVRFEPMMLPMTTSPCPWRAAANEANSSGRLVPMATMVAPITASGSPTCSARSTAPMMKICPPTISAVSPPINAPVDRPQFQPGIVGLFDSLRLLSDEDGDGLHQHGPKHKQASPAWQDLQTEGQEHHEQCSPRPEKLTGKWLRARRKQRYHQRRFVADEQHVGHLLDPMTLPTATSGTPLTAAPTVTTTSGRWCPRRQRLLTDDEG